MINPSKMTANALEALTKTVKAVCSEFGITVEELSKNQKVNQYASKETILISYARTVAMALLSKHFRQREVAAILNCSNHSTVSSAIRRVEVLSEVNPMIKEKINNIQIKLL